MTCLLVGKNPDAVQGRLNETAFPDQISFF